MASQTNQFISADPALTLVASVFSLHKTLAVALWPLCPLERSLVCHHPPAGYVAIRLWHLVVERLSCPGPSRLSLSDVLSSISGYDGLKEGGIRGIKFCTCAVPKSWAGYQRDPSVPFKIGATCIILLEVEATQRRKCFWSLAPPPCPPSYVELPHILRAGACLGKENVVSLSIANNCSLLVSGWQGSKLLLG